MLLTEEEAKTKCCPFVRVPWQNGGWAVNRDDRGSNCIASKCMAWRWGVDDPKTYEGKAPGFCGLAGKVE